MKIKAITNHIIFKFVDNVVVRTDLGKRRTQFEERTESGLTFSSFDEGTKHPRWGIVQSVGPDVKADIDVGSKILIEGLKWTEAIDIDGDNVWRTDENWVLALEE